VLAPELRFLRVIPGLAIPADLEIPGDIVDPDRGILGILFHAGGTRAAARPLHKVTGCTPNRTLPALDETDIMIVAVLVIIRVLMQDAGCRPAAPRTAGVLGDLGVPGLDMPGGPAPTPDLVEPAGDYRVEIRGHRCDPRAAAFFHNTI